jgi:hypothetical protein
MPSIKLKAGTQNVIITADGKVSCACCCNCGRVTGVIYATYGVGSPPVYSNGYVFQLQLKACESALVIDGGPDPECDPESLPEGEECLLISYNFGVSSVLTGKNSGGISYAIAGDEYGPVFTIPFLGSPTFLGTISVGSSVGIIIVFPSLPPADADGNYRLVLTIPLPYGQPSCVNSTIVLSPTLEVIHG